MPSCNNGAPSTTVRPSCASGSRGRSIPGWTSPWNELEERLAGEALHLVWEDRTQPAIDFEAMARENTLRGQFARAMNEQLAAAADDARDVLERARLYGLQALLDREVRVR